MNNLNPILFILLFILNITQISANGDDYYISFQNKAWTVPMVGEEYFTRSWTKYTRVGEYSIDDGSEYEEKNVDLTRTIANIQVTQSSLYSSNYPTKAIDTGTNYHWGSCSSTKNNAKPWFRLDLRKEYRIKEVRVRNRGDSSGERMNGLRVIAGSDPNGPHLGHETIGDHRNKICSSSAQVKIECTNGYCIGGNRNGQTISVSSNGKISMTNADRSSRFDVPCKMKARYVWIDLGGNQEHLTISDINIVADDSLGFGWTPSQKNRIENNGKVFLFGTILFGTDKIN